jgi:hypothetical protein
MVGTQIREVVTMFHAIGYCNAEVLLLLLFSKPLIKFLILFCWMLITLRYLLPELFILQISFVRILGKFSYTFSCISRLPQGSTSGPLLFIFSFCDLATRIHSSNFLLFSDDLKVHRLITSAESCKSLQYLTVIRCKSGLLNNCMRISTVKVNIISFTSKTDRIYFSCHVGSILIIHADCVVLANSIMISC